MRGAEAELAEIKRKRDEAFAKLDTDGDGTITRAEFDERAKLPTIKDPDPKPFLAQFDKDKDGSISKDEFRAPTLANFERLDSNDDGALSTAERQATADRQATAEPAAKPTKKPAIKKTPPIGR